MRARLGAAGVFAAMAAASTLALGCSDTVEVTRLVSPREASDLRGTKMAPDAVVHANGSREPIPGDAKIDLDKVTVQNAREQFVYRLQPNDVIEVDDDNRITAVRSPGPPPSWTRFAPGTARMPETGDVVIGKLAQGESTIAIGPNDKIEVTGSFVSGDRVPGGGHVESDRYTFALVTGLVVLGLSYLPTAVVGAESSRKGDRVLLLPVLGPWIDFAGRAKCQPPAGSDQLPVDPCIEETANRVAVVASGIAQALGGILVAVGLPSRATVVDAPQPGQPAQPAARVEWHVVPLTTPHVQGLGVVGRF